MEYQTPDVARRLTQIIDPVALIDWSEVMPRNLRFMRVRTWINHSAPLIVGCMLRQDDGVMIWIKFKYERVYKYCQRCGIMGHSPAHCPHFNPAIERVIGHQMETINKHFYLETFYDLQSILFTNSIQAFHNRGER